MRSSVAPVASSTFCVCPGTGAEGGETATQRMAELWALKRKVSTNRTVSAAAAAGDSGAECPFLSSVVAAAAEVRVEEEGDVERSEEGGRSRMARIPCRTLSYEPATIWMVGNAASLSRTAELVGFGCAADEALGSGLDFLGGTATARSSLGAVKSLFRLAIFDDKSALLSHCGAELDCWELN
ncbi:hypothetical protein VTK73DRAFT_5267 [Phialemonium thermophilum]|uniref:Uncharacterized protein n=1 Tax=Phialemonium thermophilum TaxID=223376 RepID=A0ABR3V388_9PEZI